MEALPQLALESICEYLAYGELHRPSLIAFASASKTCRAAAHRELFSRLSIDVDDMPQFQQRLVHVERVLDEARGRSCVRLLKLRGHTAFQTRSDDGEAADACATSMRCLPKFQISGLREWKLRTNPRPDEWWEPLARFISGFHLRDLVWASTEQVPRCVLSVLGKQSPRCRLHVHGFDLRSLHQEETLQDVDGTEYLLATSPSLHHVIAPYSMHDVEGRTNFNGEAVLRMVAESSPNLRHVCVWENSRIPAGELGSWEPRERLEWRGFRPRSNSDASCELPKTKGQLRCLEISPSSAVSGLELASWETHTDFSVLQSLRLAMQVELGVLTLLANLAERDGLGCLRVLDLPTVLREYEDREEGKSTMTRLLRLLKPLVELRLVRVVDANLEAALEQHGGTLEVFHVENFIFSPRQVARLRDCCPMIRELSIEILRSAGNYAEVEMYRNLGSMRYLVSLSLVLKCTDYRPREGPDAPCLRMGPSNDREEQEAMKAAIRQVFVNAAVDENLARSIFQTMLIAHSSLKAGLPPRLSSISLRVAGVPVLNGQIMDQDFHALLLWIGRSWSCTRDLRDTHQAVISIDEIGKDARLTCVDELEDDIDEFPNSKQYADIWHSLWPKTGAGWRNEWQSYPLSDGVGD